jgi:hypothetical protein
MATTAAIHADRDPMIQQHPREFFARELRTLVGIEDLGLAEPSKRFAEGVLSEVAPASISLSVRRHGEVPLRGLKDGQDGDRAAEEL